MPLTVTTIMGGLGRVVIGSDGKPAFVGALGPIRINLSLRGGEVMTSEPRIIAQAWPAPRRWRRPGSLGFVQSRNVNLLP